MGAREAALVLSLTVYALMTHFLLTCMLLWTRPDSVSVSLPPNKADSSRASVDNAYLSLIGAGISLLLLRFALMMAGRMSLSLRSCLALILDVWASFMLIWIMLDGLDWTTYISVFAFCVVMPACLELSVLTQQSMRSVLVSPSASDPTFKTLYYKYIKGRTKD